MREWQGGGPLFCRLSLTSALCCLLSPHSFPHVCYGNRYMSRRGRGGRGRGRGPKAVALERDPTPEWSSISEIEPDDPALVPPEPKQDVTPGARANVNVRAAEEEPEEEEWSPEEPSDYELEKLREDASFRCAKLYFIVFERVCLLVL